MKFRKEREKIDYVVGLGFSVVTFGSVVGSGVFVDDGLSNADLLSVDDWVFVRDNGLWGQED